MQTLQGGKWGQREVNGPSTLPSQTQHRHLKEPRYTAPIGRDSARDPRLSVDPSPTPDLKSGLSVLMFLVNIKVLLSKQTFLQRLLCDRSVLLRLDCAFESQLWYFT